MPAGSAVLSVLAGTYQPKQPELWGTVVFLHIQLPLVSFIGPDRRSTGGLIVAILPPCRSHSERLAALEESVDVLLKTMDVLIEATDAGVLRIKNQ